MWIVQAGAVGLSFLTQNWHVVGWNPSTHHITIFSKQNSKLHSPWTLTRYTSSLILTSTKIIVLLLLLLPKSIVLIDNAHQNFHSLENLSLLIDWSATIQIGSIKTTTCYIVNLNSEDSMIAVVIIWIIPYCTLILQLWCIHILILMIMVYFNHHTLCIADAEVAD